MPETWTISSVRSALAAKKLSVRELAADFFSRISTTHLARLSGLIVRRTP